MTIGDLVKEYRDNNKISVEEFAKKCGLSKGYISMLENKVNPRNNKEIVPTLTTLKKISSGMGIDVDKLLSALDKNQEVSISFLEVQKESRKNFAKQWNIQFFENKMLEAFSQLNDDNKERSITYTENLLANQKLEEALIPLAAHASPNAIPENQEADIALIKQRKAALDKGGD